LLSVHGRAKTGSNFQVQTPLNLYATILSASASVTHTFAKPGPEQKSRKGYIHVIQTSGYNTGKAAGARVKLNGDVELSEGDGAFAWADENGKLQIENIGSNDAEFILFDIE
jgi:quercetin 2,3-dioxygenase